MDVRIPETPPPPLSANLLTPSSLSADVFYEQPPTYLCEKTFSKMKYVKSCYRSAYSDEHLESLLVIRTTNLEPQLNKIISGKKQLYTSNCSRPVVTITKSL